MTISLSHVGEALTAEIANDMRGDFLELCGISADQAFLATNQPIAHRELPLAPYDGITFDGASRVDLVVQFSEQEATPFELKLGTTGLAKRHIDEDWVSACGFSHDGKRFKGKMMSILERKFPDAVRPADLRVELPTGATLKLTPTWFIIAREGVLKTWRGQNQPAFSDRVQFLSFEAIVEHYGGKEKFNHVVSELLSFDYFDRWVKGKAT